jgi:F-type H+-transporting ATPase subunit a
MGSSELVSPVVFQVGPAQVTATVFYSLLTSGVLIAIALLLRTAMQRGLSRWQVGAEMLVDLLESTMREMVGGDPRPFTPLVVTLALFIGVANLSGLVPGLHAATADLSTTTALAIVVFLAVPAYGIRSRGVRGYLHHYLEPLPALLPLEVFNEFSRVLTLAVRLFGNVISGELIISVLVALVGFLVPIPIMLLEVLTGVIQAYIFAMLAMVYLSAAARAHST